MVAIAISRGIPSEQSIVPHETNCTQIVCSILYFWPHAHRIAHCSLLCLFHHTLRFYYNYFSDNEYVEDCDEFPTDSVTTYVSFLITFIMQYFLFPSLSTFPPLSVADSEDHCGSDPDDIVVEPNSSKCSIKLIVHQAPNY